MSQYTLVSVHIRAACTSMGYIECMTIMHAYSAEGLVLAILSKLKVRSYATFMHACSAEGLVLAI